ncbi:4'-phosphopantetheinyl transferase family protein [Paenibacillus ginsengihumi]|uniref:4'-phosphopantetheinyl transferase family protein n=1 Tax=Paenibacillus ginsengihumi TaxID=431596 RepID=UPI00035F80BA|nr:4'-phosphopantetheinyl transferase superfamily protein [Paenibacillus ginsengihumi]
MLQICKMQVPQSLDEAVLSALLSYVDADKRVKIMKFHRQEDRIRSLFAELLARWMISARTDIPAKDIVFTKNQYGKPRLGSPLDRLYVNWTHSGRWVACAVDEGEVGIDVEQIQHVDRNLAVQCLSDMELSEFDAKHEEEQRAYFFERWTLKESYVKWDGRGLSIPFRTIFFRNSANGHYLLSGDEISNPSCYLKLYPMDEMYKMAVCSSTEQSPIVDSTMDYRKMMDILSIPFPISNDALS